MSVDTVRLLEDSNVPRPAFKEQLTQWVVGFVIVALLVWSWAPSERQEGLQVLTKKRR